MDDFRKRNEEMRQSIEASKQRALGNIQNLISGAMNDAKNSARELNEKYTKNNFVNSYLKCEIQFKGKHESMENVYDAFYAMMKKQKRNNGEGQLLPVEVPLSYFGHFYDLDVADYNEDEIPELTLYRCEANPNYDIINYFISQYNDIEFMLSYVAEDLSRAGVCYSERKNRHSNNVTDFVKVIDYDYDELLQIMEQKISVYNKIDNNIDKGKRALSSQIDFESIYRNLY